MTTAESQAGQVRDHTLKNLRADKARAEAELARTPAVSQPLAGYPDYAALRRASITHSIKERSQEIERVAALEGDALVSEFVPASNL